MASMAHAISLPRAVPSSRRTKPPAWFGACPVLWPRAGFVQPSFPCRRLPSIWHSSLRTAFDEGHGIHLHRSFAQRAIRPVFDTGERLFAGFAINAGRAAEWVGK